MKRLNLAVHAPPSGADKKIQKAYEKLSSEVADVNRQGALAVATYAEKSAQAKQLMAYDGDAVNAANAQVQARYLQCDCLTIEADTLDRELPLLARIIDYIPLVAEAVAYEKQVAEHQIDLAREQVLGVFERDYPSKKWRAHDAAIKHFVEQHPIVMGAKQRYSEMDGQHLGDAQRRAADEMAGARKRRAEIEGAIKVQREKLATALREQNEVAAKIAEQQARSAASAQAHADRIAKAKAEAVARLEV